MSIAADFTAYITVGRAPLTTTFVDTSIGTVTERIWDFGDGDSTDSEVSPTHTYTVSGVYTVKLIARNGTDESVKVRDSYIVVDAEAFSPAFVIMQSENSDTNQYWKFYVNIDRHLVFETQTYIWKSVEPIIDIHKWTFVTFNLSKELMYAGSANSRYKVIPSAKSVNTTPIIPSYKRIYVAPNSTMKMDEAQIWSRDVDLTGYAQLLRGVAGNLDSLAPVAPSPPSDFFFKYLRSGSERVKLALGNFISQNATMYGIGGDYTRGIGNLVSGNSSAAGMGEEINTGTGSLISQNSSISGSGITISTGLVAYYPFSGNANDYSGNANNGITSNVTLTTDRFGAANSAYSFDGLVNTYIRVPDSPSLALSSAITVTAWIYSNNTTGAHDIISKWEDPNIRAFIFKQHNSTDKLRLELVDSSDFKFVDLSSYTSVPIGSWVFVAFTYEPSVARLYFNGLPDGVQYTGGQLIRVTAVDILIGCVDSGLYENFDGKIDELRIYDRVLSDAEILQLYNWS